MSTSRFMILENNHKSELIFCSVYNFKVLRANFNIEGTALVLMVFLCSVCGQYKDVIRFEIPLESAEFYDFIQLAYPDEHGEVIDLRCEDLKRLTGTICLKNRDGHIELLWHTANISNACHGSAYKIKNANADNLYDGCYVYSIDPPDVIYRNNNQVALNLETEYDFHILCACFNPRQTAIQLMIELEQKTNGSRNIIFDEIPIDSERFQDFVDNAYAVEFSDVIDFDLDRFVDFFGTVNLESFEGELRIDWDYVEIDSAPCSLASSYLLGDE